VLSRTADFRENAALPDTLCFRARDEVFVVPVFGVVDVLWVLAVACVGVVSGVAGVVVSGAAWSAALAATGKLP
jgi:hypothetical protein